jgi:hypothetical protein
MKQPNFIFELPPLDKMPNVDKREVLEYITEKRTKKVIITWAINWWYKNKRERLCAWIKDNLEIDDEIKTRLKHIPLFKTNREKILEILRFTIANISYARDIDLYGTQEYWATPKETWLIKKGDCFAGYEEIYTNNGLTKIKDIKIGDEVLSYDFKTKKYVNKKVTNFINKGKLQINRVHLRNGQWFDVSENHPLWCRTSQKESIYEKTYLSNVDLTRWWKRKLPIAKKIPYNKSIPKFPKDIYRVIGHYIAEGWGGSCSSGYDLIEHILPILDKYDIKYTEHVNNSGVPCIRFDKNSELRKYIKNLKRNSFDITLYEELITLPEEYLEELLYGMWLGDGCKNIGPTHGNMDWSYSTSSKKLAEDIQRIGLHLGRTFHIWKQNNHQGVGKQPIYRISHTPTSYFQKNYGYDNISEVSISYIEKLEDTEMYDLTVEDTHTVILKNGIITHQCEDMAILIYAIARHFEIPDYQLFIVAGNVKGGGHAYLIYLDDNGIEYPIDAAYWPRLSLEMIPYIKRKNYFYGGKEWFRFNSENSYVIERY